MLGLHGHFRSLLSQFAWRSLLDDVWKTKSDDIITFAPKCVEQASSTSPFAERILRNEVRKQRSESNCFTLHAESIEDKIRIKNRSFDLMQITFSDMFMSYHPYFALPLSPLLVVAEIEARAESDVWSWKDPCVNECRSRGVLQPAHTIILASHKYPTT